MRVPRLRNLAMLRGLCPYVLCTLRSASVAADEHQHRTRTRLDNHASAEQEYVFDEDFRWTVLRPTSAFLEFSIYDAREDADDELVATATIWLRALRPGWRTIVLTAPTGSAADKAGVDCFELFIKLEDDGPTFVLAGLSPRARARSLWRQALRRVIEEGYPAHGGAAEGDDEASGQTLRSSARSPMRLPLPGSPLESHRRSPGALGWIKALMPLTSRTSRSSGHGRGRRGSGSATARSPPVTDMTMRSSGTARSPPLTDTSLRSAASAPGPSGRRPGSTPRRLRRPPSPAPAVPSALPTRARHGRPPLVDEERFTATADGLTDRSHCDATPRSSASSANGGGNDLASPQARSTHSDSHAMPSPRWNNGQRPRAVGGDGWPAQPPPAPRGPRRSGGAAAMRSVTDGQGRHRSPPRPPPGQGSEGHVAAGGGPGDGGMIA